MVDERRPPEEEKDNVLDLAAARLEAQQSKSKVKRTVRPKPSENTDDPATRLPENRCAVLEVKPGQLPELADEAERLLIEHDGNIYQRSGYLARLATAKAETVHGIKRPASTPTIVPVDPDYLLDRLNRLMAWQKWSVRMGKLVTCNAPRPVASTILARSGAWKFRQLTGVITAPTLRPDGSILDKPGYDPQTGLLFHASQPFLSVSEKPSHKEGRAALDFLLEEIFVGFDFATPHDQSAALSALLTAAVRSSLRTAPLHGFSAPRPGSGKSLLADVVAMIVTGFPATVMSFPPDGEELRKRLFTVLMAGSQVVNLDNIEGVLTGDALCMALTAETITDRLLGTQKQATAPTNVTWLATGNNLSVQGDMTRRIVLCTLDPKCERPEEREFSKDLYRWIPDHRPELIAAVLTALRSYIAAGMPLQPIRTFGSFESWSRLIRSCLVWLQEDDPLMSRASIEDADPKRQKLRSLLLGWYATFKTAEATCKEAVRQAGLIKLDDNRSEIRANPHLFEALTDHFADRRGEITTQELAEFIKRNQNRIECGVRFEAFGNYGTRKQWRVVVSDQSVLEQQLPNLLGSG